jgi:hypothetical protein
MAFHPAMLTETGGLAATQPGDRDAEIPGPQVAGGLGDDADDRLEPLGEPEDHSFDREFRLARVRLAGV